MRTLILFILSAIMAYSADKQPALKIDISGDWVVSVVQSDDETDRETFTNKAFEFSTKGTYTTNIDDINVSPSGAYTVSNEAITMPNGGGEARARQYTITNGALKIRVSNGAWLTLRKKSEENKSPQTDSQQLIGKWEFVAMEDKGGPHFGQQGSFVLTAEKTYTLIRGDRGTETGTYTIEEENDQPFLVVTSNGDQTGGDFMLNKDLLKWRIAGSWYVYRKVKE